MAESLNDIIVRILEVAEPHNDTEDEGDVFMPTEEEWGEIVGMARRAALGKQGEGR